MANPEHLALLNQGVEKWNEWRKQNPDIQQPDLSKIDLRGFNLRKFNLGGTNLKGTDLHGADLSNANIPEADLSDADLSNANLHQADFLRAKLSRSNLTEVSSGLANFHRTNLDDAKLCRAGLSGSDFSGSSLRRACLNEANLTGVDLSNANLSEADLSGAQLGYVNLSRTHLSEVDISRSVLINTIFSDNDLSTIRGLDTLIHYGPSIVNVNTVRFPYNSNFKSFLRGTGFSDIFIEYLPSLLQNALQYYSVFISYSSKDDLLARRLHADLQDRGVRCWFAPEDMKIGNKIRDRIDEAIHLQEKLLLLLSEYSVASTWVENEVETALEKEDRQQREVLFPVRLDNTVMHTSRAWAATLRRTRHIGDFTNWTDPYAYERSFERLLRDLKKAGK